MTRAPRSPDPSSWRRLAELFDRAAALPPDERPAWLDAHAGADPEIRATLEQMLLADAVPDGLLEHGVGTAASLVLEPEAHLAAGDSVGEFDVVGKLGHGGMGIVYEAMDRHLGRRVALKFLPEGLPDLAERTEQLITEAKAASALDHPNVAAIYQVGTDAEGRRFIAMPRYEGETLHARLERGALPPTEALRVARQVAAGLAAAHRAGIVHRDVTPGNVFLTHAGEAKLLDFGLAAVAGSGRDGPVARGTASGMSPEQARGAPPDTRSDVWSLGVLLYRMLTGTAPFPGESSPEILARVTDPSPSPRLLGRPGIPRRLARVVDRALQKRPDRRWADAGAMLAALERVAAPRRAAGALAGGMLLAGAAAVAFILGSRGSAGPPPPDRVSVVRFLPVQGGAAGNSTVSLAAEVTAEVAARLAALGRVRVLTGPPEAGQPVPNADVHINVADDGVGIRLDAEVIRADASAPAWSTSLPFTRAALPAVSRDLAEGILHAVGVTLSAAEQAALARSFPSSVAAYEAFLDGNRLLGLRTPATVLEAMDRYSAAHQLDAAYVPALARQAYTVALLLDWGWQHPALTRDEMLAEGRRITAEALTLDSASAEAWLARAYILAAADPYRLAGAPEAFQRAIALDPYNAEAFHQYGQALMVLGRFAEASTAYRRALELDPRAVMTLIGLAGLSEIAGRRAETVRLLDSAVRVAPEVAFAHAIRAVLHVIQGEPGPAHRAAERALALDSSFTVPGHAVMAMARFAGGDEVVAIHHLAQALRSTQRPGTPTPDEAYFLVGAWLAGGWPDSAVATLARTRPRGANLWYLMQEPSLARFRADPRARAIIAEADPRGPSSPSGTPAP